jgi:nicotinamide-nucleotide amidase
MAGTVSADGQSLKAAIIAVGSELLTPSRVETNSLHATEVLNDLGIPVALKSVVGDDRAELAAALGEARARHQVVILTGGLGPTEDDLTREVVAEQLGLPLDEDPTIVAAIERRFASRGWRMPEANRRQAQVPRGAAVLANPHGTAPGLWIEHGGSIVVLLPGPPREMKPMMSGEVRERLAARASGPRLLRRTIRVAGRSESAVDERVKPIYMVWLSTTPAIKTTILASAGQVELHLSTRAPDAASGTARLDAAVLELERALGPDLVSRDGRTLEAVVGGLLRARGWHIALAESCTGGLATSRLTDVPGSSDYVERSVVVYSNRAKTELLGVPEEMIRQHGAVSEPVAQAMAEAVRNRARVEVGVGITGVAGPTGGSAQKPVGTVCIAIAVAAPPGSSVSSASSAAAPTASSVTRARTFRFPGGRELVKSLAATSALDMVRRALAAGSASSASAGKEA